MAKFKVDSSKIDSDKVQVSTSVPTATRELLVATAEEEGVNLPTLLRQMILHCLTDMGHNDKE